jgi:hypothetical protein
VAADDGREVFLAAEGSAGLGLDNATLFSREIEYQRERMDEVERTLHRAADGYAFGRGILCDDAIILDVELLLRSGPVLAFDDEVGVLPDLVGDGRLVLLHQVSLEGVGVFAFAPDNVFFLFRIFDGVNGGQFFVGDVDSGDSGGEYGAVGMGEQEDGLFGVVDVGGG